MYICPTCGKQYKDKDLVTKHFLSCWKEKYLTHSSKDIPHIECTTREIDENVNSFFDSFKR